MPQNDFFIPPDQKARDTAVLETSKNIIVEAGAGTGKTTLLTDRLCYLILGKGIAIDKIIALTFTEKAAAEIKSRLLEKMAETLSALKGLSEPSRETENLIKKIGREKEELIKEIEQNFELAERAMISTIHGFCFKVLRRFPAEAGVAPDIMPDGDEAAQAVIDKIWSAFLDEELNYSSSNGEKWELLLRNFSLEEIKAFALALLKSPLKNYNPALRSPKTAKVLRRQALEAKRLLELYKSKRKNAFEGNLRKAEVILNNAADYHDNLEFKDLAFEPAKYSRPAGWTDDEEFEKAKNIIQTAENAVMQNIILLQTAREAVSGFLPKAKEALQKSGLISFDEMILKTRDLVKNRLHVRQTLKEEYRSILLDEFQDTDPEQGEIFLYLAEADETQASDWMDISLQPGKLFIVGDPKQSIYRFRGADIAAYDTFTDAMLKQGAVKCFLQSNFRSSSNIVAYANKFGERAIKAQRNVQPQYVPIKHTKSYKPEPVSLIIADAGENKTSAEDMRAFQAGIITSWIEENAFKTKLSSGRAMTYKDIAVLYRSATGLDVLIDAFKSAGISYSVEENKNFYQAQEVKDILNLLKLAQNPADRTALVGVLRSPLCLIKDEEILNLSQNGLLNIYADAKDEYVNSKYGALKEICRRAQSLPLEEFINYLLFETKFKEMQILCSASEQTGANISKFMDVARRFTNAGILTLPQFIYHLEHYFKEMEKEGESPLAEESLDTVKLMSIHKSKGLQSPVVIIYDITKEQNKGNKKAPQILSDWLSASAAPRLGKVKDLSYVLLEQANNLHAKAEELRILYVALTRAEEKLLITGAKDAQKTLAAPLLNAGCYPGDGAPAILLDGICQAVYIPFKENDLRLHLGGKTRAEQNPEKFKLWREAWLERSARYDAAMQESPVTPSGSNRQEELGPAQASAMLTGRICHRMLAQMFNGERPNADKAAAEEGANPIKNAKEISAAKNITESFAKSDAFKELAAMEFKASELPFSMKDPQTGIYANGIIDAVFEDAQGSVFIAEFKSDNINKEQVRQNAEKYSAQLEVYLKAAKLLFKGKNIKGALVFLRPHEIYFLGDN